MSTDFAYALDGSISIGVAFVVAIFVVVVVIVEVVGSSVVVGGMIKISCVDGFYVL